jgi:hypothetical protein
VHEEWTARWEDCSQRGALELLKHVAADIVAASAAYRGEIARSFAAYLTGGRVNPAIARDVQALLGRPDTAAVWNACNTKRLTELRTTYIELRRQHDVHNTAPRDARAASFHALQRDVEAKQRVVEDLRAALAGPALERQ